MGASGWVVERGLRLAIASALGIAVVCLATLRKRRKHFKRIINIHSIGTVK